MSDLFSRIVCVSFLLLAVACQDRDALAGDAMPTTRPTTGVAVVELFTSQGCSSCPPAEELIGKIDADAHRTGQNVFALAFHVDYWNHLGWADPFSDPAYSRRQTSYANKLKLDQIYTPQMIVNGQSEFVGSDSARARQSIREVLQTPALATVSLSPQHDGSVSYQIGTSENAAIVNIGIVEDKLRTAIKRGENAGQTLDQPAVVRWFTTQELHSDGKGEITLPPLEMVNLHHARLIVYVQRTGDFRIIGAGALAIDAQ